MKKLFLFPLLLSVAFAQCITGPVHLLEKSGSAMSDPGHFHHFWTGDSLLQVGPSGVFADGMMHCPTGVDSCTFQVPTLCSGLPPVWVSGSRSNDSILSPPNFLRISPTDTSTIDSTIFAHCPPVVGPYVSKLQFALDSLLSITLPDSEMVFAAARAVHKYHFYAASRRRQVWSWSDVMDSQVMQDSGTWCGGFSQALRMFLDTLTPFCSYDVGLGVYDTVDNSGGHIATLVRIYGKYVLIDAMFGLYVDKDYRLIVAGDTAFNLIRWDNGGVFISETPCKEERAEYGMDCQRFPAMSAPMIFQGSRTVENYLQYKAPSFTPKSLYSSYDTLWLGCFDVDAVHSEIVNGPTLDYTREMLEEIKRDVGSIRRRWKILPGREKWTH